MRELTAPAEPASDKLELRSVVAPTLPLFAAIFIGGAVATATDSLIPMLAGLLIIGIALLVVELVHVKRVLLTIVVLEIPLQLDTYINHNPAELASSSGFNVSVTTICLVALYALWLSEAAAGRYRDRYPVSATIMPAALYTTAVVASMLVADNVVLSLYEVNVIIQALMLIAYIVHAIQTRRDVLYAVVLLVIGFMFQGLIAIAQQALGLSFQIGPVRAEIVGGRVAGTLRHPNRLASYVALMLGPALGLMLTSTVPRFYRRLAGASIVMGVVALLFTQSRGGVIAAFVGVAIAVGFAYRRQWLTRRTLITGGLVLLIAIVTQSGGFASRLETAGATNVVGRFRLLELAFELIRNSPLLGVGSNHFSHALPQVVTLDFTGAWLATVHNKYVLVWVETGLLGLVTFGYFLLTILRRAWQVFAGDDEFLSPLALGFLSGFIALMVHMNFDKFGSRADVHLLWLVAGIMLAIYRVRSAELVRKAETVPGTDSSAELHSR